MSPLQPPTAGRLLLTLQALTNALGPFYFDWNETHIHNPRWPPHARFHNGQTMSIGALIGALTLYLAWRPTSTPKDSIWTAALVGSLYWVSGLSANLYPGALAVDPEFGTGSPQLPLFGGYLALTWIGYALEMRKLGGKESKGS